ncbi:hypothetical protein SELMODRAFT_107483, partial [Selaginella moellendorffii]
GLAIAISDGVLNPPLAVAQDKNTGKKKKIVILGTGWAGVSLLKDLDDKQYDVVVISPRNYFVFTPLLPSVTAGTLEPRSITEPVRRIVAHRNVMYCEAECTNIDHVTKTVTCVDCAETKPSRPHVEFKIDYDYLVIAVGCQTNTFGTPGVAENCHFLKEVEDAERIHQNVVDCFESASIPTLSDAERRARLNFVVVGGGPTGVEFAAELYDLVYEDLVDLYPVTRDAVSITLIQSGDHILNMFDERISKYAEDKFKRDGINVQTNCHVNAVKENEVETTEKKSGQTVMIPFSLAVWSTGIGTRPLIRKFMEQVGQKNRRVLATDEWLRVRGCEGVFAVGDCATIEQRKIMEDITYIFKLADKDQNGILSLEEFKEAMETIRGRYPQIDMYLKSHHLANTMSLLHEAKQLGQESEVELDIDKFKQALAQVDSETKLLPATAQVAAQQGTYLARCFNDMDYCEEHPEGPVRVRASGRHRFQPFRYKHFGMFAPLGGEEAAAELPGDWVSIGRSSMWLWYSVYLSKQVSWRTRFVVLFDWTKRFVFGRDSTRI